MRIISSQKYRDSEIVAKKINDKDFNVFVSPVFNYEGDAYQIIIDGHHSHQAAIDTNNDPIFTEMDNTECDYISILLSNPELGLEIAWQGDDWYDIQTGADIW